MANASLASIIRPHFFQQGIEDPHDGHQSRIGSQYRACEILRRKHQVADVYIASMKCLASVKTDALRERLAKWIRAAATDVCQELLGVLITHPIVKPAVFCDSLLEMTSARLIPQELRIKVR